MTTAANILTTSPAGAPLAAARKYLTARLAIAAYLAAGAIAVVAYYLVDAQLTGASFVATSALSLAALLLGPLAHRPARTLPWRWLAAAIGAFLLGDAARLAVRLGRAAELAWLADISYVGYIFLAIGLMSFIRVRRPRYRLARLVDGLAVGTVAALTVSLTTLGTAAESGIGAYGVIGLVVTPTYEALLLGATAYLVFAGDGLRGRAQQLLLLGVMATAGADVIYNVHGAPSGPMHSLMDTLWMASYLLIGLTALVPSMRVLTEPQTEEPERAAGRAMLGLLGAVAVLTTFDVMEKLTNGDGGAWFEMAEAALIVLVLVRARQAAQLDSARERRVAVLLANAADALTVVGADGLIQIANPASARMFGVPYGSSIGRPVTDFVTKVHPDEQESVRRRLSYVVSTPGSTDRVLIRIRAEDGTYRSLDTTVSNRLADPDVGGIVINFRDITDQLRADAELGRLGTAIEQANDAVLITDAAGNIEYVNPGFERITGYTRAEVVGRNPRFLKSGEQAPAFYEAMWETLSAGRAWRADFVNKRKDGALYRMAGVITPLRGETGEVTGYVSVSRDLTHQRELETAARNLARERALIADTIRGIDPREAPEKIAQAVCSQLASMNDVAMAGLFIYDADGRAAPFGFAVASGEQAPRRRVPKARTTYLRERTAGGPWIEAWIERPTHPYNELILRSRVKALAYAPVRDNDRTIGFIVAGSSAKNAEEQLASMLSVVVECGDLAGTLIGVRVAERSELSAERRRISQIIEGHAFFPVFQPLYDTQTERVVGYEALTRFDDGVPPDLRFAEAHEVGLGEKLELAAIVAAIEASGAIPRDLWLNLNASPVVLLDSSGELARLVNESDRDIVLEVTEHTEITDYDVFRRAIHDLGPKVRLAVDDAGAGFASLRHIIELRPAFVKLDRQVIAGIDSDEARQAMVAGLRHFSRNTGCWLIAEGVETTGELQTLRELDVRYVQGYLLGRPVPAHELVGLSEDVKPSPTTVRAGLSGAKGRRR